VVPLPRFAGEDDDCGYAVRGRRMTESAV